MSAARTGYTSGVSILLAVGVLLGHGWCLGDGSVLDDHQHQKALREYGWSLAELQRSLVIEPSQWMHHWWQDKAVRWEYARPLFILTMKFLYRVLGGDDPWILHAYSLVLHVLCAAMVWRLGLMLTGDRFWSAVGGLLFVLYPHAVMTIQWSSSQNCAQQTMLTLGAVLAYLRASGLTVAAGDAATRPPARTQGGWLALTVGLWVAALLTKENAIVLPAILLALDAALGGRRHALARWPVYALLAVIGVAFVAYRAAVISVGMPDVYIRRMDGDFVAYAAWCAAKLLHYVCTSIWPAPMMIGPTGRYDPWRESTVDCMAMLGIVGVLTAGYLAATRGLRGRWVGPLWVLLAVLPVTPVIATAHSGYFAGVGFALSMAFACASGRAAASHGPRTGEDSAAGRGRGMRAWGARTARGLAVISLVVFSLLTMLNRWQWVGIIAAERYVPAWVRAAPPPPEATDVFFLNLPFVNIYAKPALVREVDPRLEEVRFHVLTYAPQPVLLEQRTHVEQLDDHRLAISIAGQPYFSRLLGRFLIDGFRRGGPFAAGEVVHADGFDVTIDDADEEGVRRLVFSFPRRLDDPRYCFYLTTIDCGATRLRFRGGLPEPASDAVAAAPADGRDGSSAAATDAAGLADAIARLKGGDAGAAEAIFDALGAADPAVVGAAEDAIRTVGGWAAQATGSRFQDWLIGPPAPVDELGPPPRIRPPPAAGPPPRLGPWQWEQVRAWWRRSIDDGVLAETWLRRHEFDALIKQREEVPHARQWAALVVRSDLYLTGPPFPGPRPRR